MAGLEIRHRSNFECGERPAFSTDSGSHCRRLPAASLLDRYQVRMLDRPGSFQENEELIDQPMDGLAHWRRAPGLRNVRSSAEVRCSDPAPRASRRGIM